MHVLVDLVVYLLPLYHEVMWCEALGDVISRHRVSFHCFADDTQQYLSTHPNPSPKPSLVGHHSQYSYLLMHYYVSVDSVKCYWSFNFLLICDLEIFSTPKLNPSFILLTFNQQWSGNINV